MSKGLVEVLGGSVGVSVSGVEGQGCSVAGQSEGAGQSARRMNMKSLGCAYHQKSYALVIRPPFF